MRKAISALVAKDFSCFLRERRTLVSVLVMALLCPMLGSNPFFAVMFSVFPAYTMATLLFSYDEKYGADRFFASLPVSRASMVIARYGGVLLAALAGLAISCGSDLLFLALGSGVKPFGGLFFLSFAAFFTVNVSLIIPLYYKVGIAKARIVSLLLMMVPGMAGGALIGWNQMMPGATLSVPGAASGTSVSGALASAGSVFSTLRMPGFVFPAVLAGCLAVLAASALVSVRIFRAKEL